METLPLSQMDSWCSDKWAICSRIGEDSQLGASRTICEEDADPTSVDLVQPRKTTVSEAVRVFLNDEEARALEHSSRKKSRTLFELQFLPFCEARKFTHIDRLMPIDLTESRSTWNNGDVTTHRKHERMHSFFAFCVANGLEHFHRRYIQGPRFLWAFSPTKTSLHALFGVPIIGENALMQRNVMDALKKPKMPDVVPTDYLRPIEFQKIIAATEKYEYGGGNDSQYRGERLRALTLLMRWSGLSILDATSLHRNDCAGSLRALIYKNSLHRW